MNIPEWLRPGIYGVAIGAILVGVVGFSWGGWVTSKTADDRAQALSRDNVVSAMVPVCLDIARKDPERMAKLETIESAASYKKRDALIATGWATAPGGETPDRDVAQACLSALEL